VLSVTHLRKENKREIKDLTGSKKMIQQSSQQSFYVGFPKGLQRCPEIMILHKIRKLIQHDIREQKLSL